MFVLIKRKKNKSFYNFLPSLLVITIVIRYLSILLLVPLFNTCPSFLIDDNCNLHLNWRKSSHFLGFLLSKYASSLFIKIHLIAFLGSRFWLDPVLVHSRNLIRFSLSALPSSELTREALRMFQVCLLSLLFRVAKDDITLVFVTNFSSEFLLF